MKLKVAMDTYFYLSNDKDNLHNSKLVRIDFPSLFLDELENIMFPKWYAACFMEDVSNSACWSHYANNHKGVCLIYESTMIEDKPYIKVELPTTYSSKGIDFNFVDLALKKVHYFNRKPEVDFFNSLGTLTADHLHKDWIKERNSSVQSIRAKEVSNWSHEKIKDYHHTLSNVIHTKEKVWQYEDEYRLSVTSSFYVRDTKEKKKIKYDFMQLNGIIFGMKTDIDDIIKIQKSIAKLCIKHKRQSFNFYQARYDNLTGKIIYDLFPMMFELYENK